MLLLCIFLYHGRCVNYVIFSWNYVTISISGFITFVSVPEINHFIYPEVIYNYGLNKYLINNYI